MIRTRPEKPVREKAGEASQEFLHVPAAPLPITMTLEVPMLLNASMM